jgi:hypothetical protein
MKVILVLGGGGLVGKTIKDIDKPVNYKWVYATSSDADLRDINQVRLLFEHVKPTFVIHIAANVSGLFKDGKHDADVLVFPCKVREVSSPDVMRIRWHNLHEQVRVYGGQFPRFLPPPCSSPIRFDAEEAHHAPYFLFVLLEVERKAAMPVCGEFPQHFFDTYLEYPVLLGALLSIP